MTLPTSEHCMLQYLSVRQYMPTGAIVERLFRECLTTFRMDLKPALQEGTDAWYYKQSKPHRYSVLVNGHLVILPSKY